MLVLKNIQLSFDYHHILDDISITFPDVGFIGIEGKSGCGKTTLLYVISGFLKPQVGDIIFNNQKVNLKLAKKAMSIMRQNNDLIAYLTVKENIQIASQIAGIQFNYDEYLSILKRLDIESLENKYPHELSVGEMKRVSIARSLLKKSPILLCDEPTGALHQESRIEIMNLLKEVSHSCLVIIVSHHQQLLKDYCDSIITLNEGKIQGNIIEKQQEIEKPQEKYTSLFFTALKQTKYYKRQLISFVLFQTFLLSSLFLLTISSQSISHTLQDYYQNHPLKNVNIISKKNKSSLNLKLPARKVFDTSLIRLEKGRAELLPLNTQNISLYKGYITNDTNGCILSYELDKKLNHPKEITYSLDQTKKLQVTGVLKPRLLDNEIVYLHANFGSQFPNYYKDDEYIVEGKYEDVLNTYKDYDVYNDAFIEKESFSQMLQIGRFVSLIFMIISTVISFIFIRIVFETLSLSRKHDNALLISMGITSRQLRTFSLIEGLTLSFIVSLFSSLIMYILMTFYNNFYSEKFHVIMQFSYVIILEIFIYLLFITLLTQLSIKKMPNEILVSILREVD